MTDHPRLTVIIPAYQSEVRIGRTLIRLREQTFSDFEILVVDDGSTDDTSAIVRDAARSDRRIRLIEQENAGIAGARNRAIELARSDVFAFLDDDDLWLPNKLELQMARLQARPDAAVVACYSAVVDSAGRLLGWRIGGAPEGRVYEEMLEWDMVSGGSVALVARQPIEAVGGFDASLPERADWDLWIRLARAYPFTCVPRVLVGYTRRPGSASRNYVRMIEQGQRVLAKARCADPTIGDRTHRALQARDRFGAACFSLFDGHRAEAWRYVWRSLRDGLWIIVKRPRRCGILVLLVLATVLPPRAYRWVLAKICRSAFGLAAGSDFDSLG